MCGHYLSDEKKIPHTFPLNTDGRKYVMSFLQTHTNGWTQGNYEGNASFDASLDWDRIYDNQHDLNRHTILAEIHTAAIELLEILGELTLTEPKQRTEYKELALVPDNYKQDEATLFGLMHVFGKVRVEQ